jgi:hypothetical protein
VVQTSLFSRGEGFLVSHELVESSAGGLLAFLGGLGLSFLGALGH